MIKKEYKINLAETLEGHWYDIAEKVKGDKFKNLGIFPSATTILNAYPQSPHLQQWIAEKGWNESQKIKSEAGVAGTQVHQAIELLLGGQELQRGFYGLKEWTKIYAFVKWYLEYNPKILFTEKKIYSKKYKYAGTFDCLAELDGRKTIIDWKTAQSVHPHYYLQISAYSSAWEEMTGEKIDQTAILQIGNKSKSGFRFIINPEEEWKEHFQVFRAVKTTWEYDRGGSEPEIVELPQTLKKKLK